MLWNIEGTQDWCLIFYDGLFSYLDLHFLFFCLSIILGDSHCIQDKTPADKSRLFSCPVASRLSCVRTRVIDDSALPWPCLRPANGAGNPCLSCGAALIFRRKSPYNSLGDRFVSAKPGSEVWEATTKAQRGVDHAPPPLPPRTDFSHSDIIPGINLAPLKSLKDIAHNYLRLAAESLHVNGLISSGKEDGHKMPHCYLIIMA